MDTKIFAKTLEQSAKEQIERLSNSPEYGNNKIRIMPDAHAGKGCTIGTTIKLTDKVTPEMVGVDIGCGVNISRIGTEIDLVRLDSIINENIPSGFNIHKEIINHRYTDIISDDLKNLHAQIDIDYSLRSLGTLGGGNHFIEVGFSEKENVYYLVIHTGSRKLGVDICKYHQSKCTTDGEIPYLCGDNFYDYLWDVSIAEKYAFVNRAIISDIILTKIDTNLKWYSETFDTPHNYIDNDNILRKGAISALKGQKVAIPINMKDGTLICVGKGNSDWNYSAPHGAGRLLSRGAAKRTLSMDDYRESMSGIYSTSVCESTLDESPMAYKPMNEILEAIKDTVDVIDILKPVYNFKAK